MTTAPAAVSLDATLKGKSSNSYITLETADQIAETMTGGDDWLDLDDEERELSLIVATRWMETLTYGGERCEDDQRLKWPRKGAKCDGRESDCEGIPFAIQETEVALALKYTTSPTQFPGGGGGAAPTGTYVKRQKLDVLEIEYDEFSNPESSSCDTCGSPAIIQAFPWLTDMLGCWASIDTGSNRQVRLYRN